ncbi:MAG: HAD-IIB family hydrolase, partial [Gammaproteobacteria bacterium]
VSGHNLELGRDADTGGQIKYVIELARALAKHPEVGRVDVVTRLINDPKIDDDYQQNIETLEPKANIVRIPCGPQRYLKKESLWPYLDSFVDNAITYLRKIGRTPDIIHSHYADAGLAGSKLSQLLGIPLIHTGHSLGRVKKQRLLDHGLNDERIERQYHLQQRIEAEEITLGNESMVITSTRQEVDEQYSQYENYHPSRMIVIPPGVDIERFHPPTRNWKEPPIAQELKRFLSDPDKPMILALSRPDPRKNIETLVKAYAENSQLRNIANLVIVAGNRDNITHMDKGAQEVLKRLLHMIDTYDLYGSIAYPKHHLPNDVPDLYRLTTKLKGVFVNPALTEPFGLTLIEAAASGAPIVATHDGGPADIIENCKNGVLIDPLDADAMGAALLDALSDSKRWKRWSQNGIKGTNQHYTWDGHAEKYVSNVKRILSKKRRSGFIKKSKSRLPKINRLLVCDIDNTLLGDKQGLRELMSMIHDHPSGIGFAIATGRRIDSAKKILKEWDVPVPDILITAVGAEIYYGNSMTYDESWYQKINYRWHPEKLRKAMEVIPGLKLQPQTEQRDHKVSFYIDPDEAPTIAQIRKHLRKIDLHAKIIYSHEAFLDFLPVRASKGLAVRHISMRWDIPCESILVAGDSGNDEEMLRGNTLGVVVGNYSKELEKLRNSPRIYFANDHYARGIIEGIHHYNFLDTITVPA